MSKPSALSSYVEQYPSQEFRRGSVLLRPDQPLSHVWYSVSGRVIQYSIDRSGNKLIMNIYKAGTLFPIYLVVSDAENDFFFEVDSDDAVLRRVPTTAARTFFQEYPEEVYDAFSRLSRAVTGLLQRLSIHMSGTAEARLLIELLIQAQRFGTVTADGRLMIHVTEQQLAAQAGIARETVSRELSKLARQQLIERKGRNITVAIGAVREHLEQIA